MRALRSFHFPSSSHGSYAEAHLTISGLGAWFFPPSPCRTLVRTLPVLNSDGQRTGAVKWLRSFGGETFVASVHTYPDEQRGSKDAASSIFHPVEEMFPLQITFDWERSQSHDNGGGDDGRVLVAPRFVGVSLLGVLSLPPWLMRVEQQMALREDGKGWHLRANVSALGGLLRFEAGTGRSDEQHHEPREEEEQEDKEDDRNEEGERSAVFVDGFHDLVLFDGTCNLCNASVDFLLARDADQRLLFGAQQSAAAQEALERYRRRAEARRGGGGGRGESATAAAAAIAGGGEWAPPREIGRGPARRKSSRRWVGHLGGPGVRHCASRSAGLRLRFRGAESVPLVREKRHLPPTHDPRGFPRSNLGR